MLSDRAFLVVEVTISSRNLSPAASPLGVRSQPMGTMVSVDCACRVGAGGAATTPIISSTAASPAAVTSVRSPGIISFLLQ